MTEREQDARLSHPGVDAWLTRLEAMADQWAVEIDLPGMIRNVVHVSRLTAEAPQNVREKFIERQAAQIDAIVKQAFIEGAYRALEGAYRAAGE